MGSLRTLFKLGCDMVVFMGWFLSIICTLAFHNVLWCNVNSIKWLEWWDRASLPGQADFLSLIPFCCVQLGWDMWHIICLTYRCSLACNKYVSISQLSGEQRFKSSRLNWSISSADYQIKQTLTFFVIHGNLSEFALYVHELFPKIIRRLIRNLVPFHLFNSVYMTH